MSKMIQVSRTTCHAVVWAALLVGLSVLTTRYALADDTVALGAKAFRVCSACHSLKPGLNMTGPSLAGVWEREAGGLTNFERYSDALKNSGVTWNASTLDAWLTNPAQFIPGNSMTYAGVSNPQIRGALVEFMRDVNKPGKGGPTVDLPSAYTATPKDLKQLALSEQVKAIRSCRDSYFVTTGDERTRAFWDQSLRFETDGSRFGPDSGKPAILPAGMFGDRATVIFSQPGEISGFIKQAC
jgi:cytochrome c